MPFAAAHVHVALTLTGGCVCVAGVDLRKSTNCNIVNRNYNPSSPRADD